LSVVPIPQTPRDRGNLDLEAWERLKADNPGYFGDKI